MKILLEEIVKRHPQDGPDKGPGNRYRRSQIALFECPVELLPVLQDGYVLTLDVDPTYDANTRRRLVVADTRVAAVLCDGGHHIGLIIDLIDPALYAALEEDQEAPADYAAFCVLENIEP